MRGVAPVHAAGRAWQVRELTLAEIRALLLDAERLEAQPDAVDVIGELLFADISLGLLAHICGCPVADFDALTQSELRTLADAAKAANPDFFALSRRLVAAVAGLDASAATSNSAPPPSPGTATPTSGTTRGASTAPPSPNSTPPTGGAEPDTAGA